MASGADGPLSTAILESSNRGEDLDAYLNSACGKKKGDDYNECARNAVGYASQELLKLIVISPKTYATPESCALIGDLEKARKNFNSADDEKIFNELRSIAMNSVDLYTRIKYNTNERRVIENTRKVLIEAFYSFDTLTEMMKFRQDTLDATKRQWKAPISTRTLISQFEELLLQRERVLLIMGKSDLRKRSEDTDVQKALVSVEEELSKCRKEIKNIDNLNIR